MKPEPDKIRFLLWRGGEPVPGGISVRKIVKRVEGVGEQVAERYRVYFEPVEFDEGTYIAYFNYAGEATFWTFSVEITRVIPEFTAFRVPKDGERNFPPEGTIVVSFQRLINIDTVDIETVRVMKRIELGEYLPIPFESEYYYPNLIAISPGEREISTNCVVEISGVSELLRFRTIPALFRKD
ncbi:MAG: hypothetical protein Q9N34_08620 [Aquificota bacterium]|nr:hypothetical protein [Aquificota bacterium]